MVNSLAPLDQHMSLDHIALPGFADRRGVHFPMMNGNAPVRVFITRAALQGEGPHLEETQFIARFNAFRDVYEAVAKEKYSAGGFKASMTIDLADLARYLGERQR
jgi:uncharacterized protein DUF1488